MLRAPGPDRRLTAPARAGPRPRRLERGPALGAFYDWTVEHPYAGGALWRAGIGSDLGRLYAAAAEIGRQPAGARILDVPCGGGVALRGLRPGQGVEYVAADIAPAMLDRTLAAARRRGVADQVVAAAGGRGGRCRSRTAPSTWSSRSPACTASPTRRGRSSRWCGCSGPAGSSPAARCSTTPGCATSRSAPPARLAGLLGPGCTGEQVTGLAGRPRAWTSVTLETSGALGYFRGVKRRLRSCRGTRAYGLKFHTRSVRFTAWAVNLCAPTQWATALSFARSNELEHLGLGLGAADPLGALDGLAGLQVLVDLEEVLDLEAVELRDVVDVAQVLEARVVRRGRRGPCRRRRPRRSSGTCRSRGT